MRLAVLIAAVALAATGAADAADSVQSPYWASISAGRARTRTGPARTYPAMWLYQRAGLPVRVVAAFKEWRRVEDPDGAQGWMQANLLSLTRTAIIRGGTPAPMLERPVAGSKLKWRAAPGVVGHISQCGRGWCQFDIHGRSGFVELAHLWGVTGDETLR